MQTAPHILRKEMLPASVREKIVRVVRLDPRYWGPILITLILLVGHLSLGILESFTQTAVAVVTSICAEIALSLYIRRTWPHLASAYISGISVGILLRSPFYWPFVLCSLLTITSKYVLRYRNRHLWNPSNFGICVIFFLVPSAVAPLSIQWGNDVTSMAVIWLLGSVIIWRAKRIHVSLTYVLSFLLFSAVRSVATGDNFLAEVAPITGPMYQLFVFFMITDPRTTVRSRRGRMLVAGAVAFVEMFLRLGESIYAPFYALFLVGPAALLIEQILATRKEAPTARETDADRSPQPSLTATDA